MSSQQADQSNPRRVDIFVDLRSPYSYVFKQPMRDMADEFGLELHWYPYAIDIDAAYGAADARGERALRKVKYIYRDARRFAQQQGLELRGPRKIYDPALAHMGMLHAKRENLLRPYMDAVYEGFFTHRLDIEDSAAIAALVESIGGSAKSFLQFATQAGRDELGLCYAGAESRSVFGVPSFIHMGELYWGSDRLAFLGKAVEAACTPDRA